MKKAEPTIKPKTQKLPGMEERDITEIVTAAENYRESRDERSRLSKLENEHKQGLIYVMHKHKRTFYNYRGLFISLTSEESVKVKAKDEEAEVVASKRNTREMVESLAAAKPPQQEPTTEESQENAKAYIAASLQEFNQNHSIEAAIAGDDFTAEICGECRALDGSHSVDCSKGSGLAPKDYLEYAKAMGVKSTASHARKWELTHEKDGLIKAWKTEGTEAFAKRVKKSKPSITPASPSNARRAQRTK